MRNLTADESEKKFLEIVENKLSKQETTDFLLALRNKGETADEILGAVKALQSKMEIFEYAGDLIDVCGTGGDGLKTLNISTAVGFVLAACGIKVVKHGNKAISSLSGSTDVLTSLSARVGKKFARKSLDETNFCYFHAPDYHPALKALADIRRDIKGRTIFNLIGPLLNPARPKFQLIGVYDAKLVRIYAEVLRKLGAEKAWVVNGADGLDEISISRETFVAELDRGAIDNFIIDPETAGLAQRPLDEITGGEPDFNAQKLEELLRGNTGAYYDIVILNAAAGLMIMGKVQSLDEGAKIAGKAIDSGAAYEVLVKLRVLA